MIAPTPLWHEFDIGDVTVRVSGEHPVAVVRDSAAGERVLSWPDLDVGLRATSLTVLAAPTGVWAVYSANQSEADTVPPGAAAAVHIGVDGTLTRFEGLSPAASAGATSHGLWLHASTNFPAPDDAAFWLSDAEITVLGVDGTRRQLRIDRRIAFVFERTEGSVLLVYSGAPLTERRFGGTSYTYRYHRVPLEAGALPARVDTADSGAPQIDDEALFAELNTLAARVVRDGPGAEIGWQRVDMSIDDRAEAVDAVTAEFAHLDAYWGDDTGAKVPLTQGISDSRLDVRGEWPHTTVEVSFRHPRYSEVRLRRTIRVFDDAGRFIPPLYASIHLMEDLDTTALPPLDAAVDGILDI